MLILRLACVPIVAGAVVLGVWVTGGVLTDNFVASVILTGVWFAAAGLAALVTASRVPALRVPVLGAYAVTALALSAWLGLNTLRDRVVDEAVATGVAASMVGSQAQSGDRAPLSRTNVELAAGTFRSGEHTTTGRAAVVRLANGRRVLTLTGFDTSAGPDLRVRLVPGDTLDGAAAGNIDLGPLKGNRGDQQYELPAGVAVAGRSVVIWCRAFSAPFGSAVLHTS